MYGQFAGVTNFEITVLGYLNCNTTARVTIENFWARRERDAGETRARTFTNFDRGTVNFSHMGVLVSRICTIFNFESVLKIFSSFKRMYRTCTNVFI